jgi:transposase InsO family protein
VGLRVQHVQIAAAPVPAPLTLDVERWGRVEAPQDAPSNLSVEDRAEAERRFGMIEPLVFPDRFRQLWQDCGGRKQAVEHEISRRLGPDGPKARTIRRWLAKYKAGGMAGLVRPDRPEKGKSKIKGAAKDQIIALATPKRGSFGTLSVNEIYRAYEDERVWRESRIGQKVSAADVQKYKRYLDEEGHLIEQARLPRYGLTTVRDFVASIPEAMRTLARDGEERYRNTQEIISHRALTEIDPLEWLVMDHRILDAFCLVPVRGGVKLARPWLTAAICMRTRRFVGWGIFETPSSDSIATVLKKTFIEHGIPRNVLWDNGRDFRCEWLEGGRRQQHQAGRVGELDGVWRGVMGTLGIRVTHALAYNARAKIIEPCFKRIANFDRQLPEWCGHKPGARPERFDQMVKQHEAWERGERQASPFRTIQQIAALYDAAIADLNERELQGDGMKKIIPGRGIGWMSPAECWDLLIGRVERRTVRTEDLHIVFSKRRALTVKHGEICTTFGGQRFYYRLEADPTQLMAVNGQLVEIAFDPNELSQVACYWRDRFIGLAHSVELRKQGEAGFVEDEKQRRAARREIKELIKSVHRSIPVASPEERLARRREIQPAREPVNRVEVPAELPPAMQDAADAARAERQFSFADTQGTIEVVTRQPVADDDGAFNFFSDQGN